MILFFKSVDEVFATVGFFESFIELYSANIPVDKNGASWSGYLADNLKISFFISKIEESEKVVENSPSELS